MWAATDRVLQVLIREGEKILIMIMQKADWTKNEFTDEFTDEHALANSQG